MKVIPVQENTSTVIEKAPIKPPVIVMAGLRGADGKNGESAEAINTEAGEDISALKVVYLKNNKAYLLDYQDDENIFFLAGLSITTAVKGHNMLLKQTGRLVDNAFNFNLGRVYLGTHGGVTQTPPTHGYSVLLGVATANNTLLLTIDDPIRL